NRLIIRDSNGRASVATPTSSSHIATKGYVDNVWTLLVGSLQAGTAFAYYLTPPGVELSSDNTTYGLWVQNTASNVIAYVLLPGTIRYCLQYRGSGTAATCYVRILLNGSQIDEESTSSISWREVIGNITVNPGDIIT